MYLPPKQERKNVPNFAAKTSPLELKFYTVARRTAEFEGNLIAVGVIAGYVQDIR